MLVLWIWKKNILKHQILYYKLNFSITHGLNSTTSHDCQKEFHLFLRNFWGLFQEASNIKWIKKFRIEIIEISIWKIIFDLCLIAIEDSSTGSHSVFEDKVDIKCLKMLVHLF